jgi:hypothetical protein
MDDLPGSLDGMQGIKESESAACGTLGLPLGDQVLGDLGLPLQPRQLRLLIHAGHLFAGGQPLAP